MIKNALFLYPLQLSVTDFSLDSGTTSTGAIIFGSIVVGLVLFFIIFNAAKGNTVKTGASSGTAPKLFTGFALYKLTKNIGLNHEQKKMLNYVFKVDGVTDPEKSLTTPALLDRHFRRAYRIIEQSAKNPEEAQHKHSVLFSLRNILENSSIGGITNTRQLKDDTVLNILTGKEKLNVAVVSTKGDHLAVEAPKNVLGSQIKILKGTRLNVLFFSKSNKGFSFETRVTGYSSKFGQPTMQLAHSSNMKFLSQRRFRRKQALIACFLYLVYVEGSGKKQRLVVDKRRLSGNIADVSVGGCSIKTNAPINVGARFKIEFTKGENVVTALGMVLRTNRSGNNTIIHIKFLKVTQRSMNLINAFVYEYTNE